MAQSPLKDTTQPVDSEEEGRSSTMDRRWLIEKKASHVPELQDFTATSRPLFKLLKTRLTHKYQLLA